jgi:D-alanyl-D-alanine carboxypeptidase
MQFLRGAFLILAALLVACTQDAVTEPADPFDPVLAKELDALVTENLPKAKAPGVGVAVMRGDGSVHLSVAGQASLDPWRNVSPTDVFRIASITKMFVATVIMQLDGEGVLSINDPVQKWVPRFQLGEAVTLRRLMNHTSGVYNFTDDPAFLSLSGNQTNPEEVVDWAIKHGSLFEPGTGWTYSNTNYFLLGLTIEAATKQRLADVLRQRLFVPLDFKDAWIEGTDPSAVPSVTGYLSSSDPGPSANTNWSWAAGGMNTSAATLCRWTRALFSGSGQVLPAERVDEMSAATKLLDGRKVEYGLGVDRSKRGGRQVVGHTGSTMGFQSEVFYDPANGDCVAVIANDFFADPTAVAAPLWEALNRAEQ